MIIVFLALMRGGMEFGVRFKFMFCSLGEMHDLLEHSSLLLHEGKSATSRDS